MDKRDIRFLQTTKNDQLESGKDHKHFMPSNSAPALLKIYKLETVFTKCNDVC